MELAINAKGFATLEEKQLIGVDGGAINWAKVAAAGLRAARFGIVAGAAGVATAFAIGVAVELATN